MDSVARDNEEKLSGALTELGKAEANLAKYERAFKAPREPFEALTKEEIAEAQKASRAKQAKVTGVRQSLEYRNYIIHYYRKPVPGFGDWSFDHVDYDGAPDGPGTSCSDHRCGYAESPQEARDEIDAQYEDLELDENGHYTREATQ